MTAERPLAFDPLHFDLETAASVIPERNIS
jgi:hypothetical protein